MTPLTKATVRESSERDAGRNIVVIVGPGAQIGFRLKGTRTVYTVTVRDAYKYAVAAEMAYKKRLKAKKKEEKKRGY